MKMKEEAAGAEASRRQGRSQDRAFLREQHDHRGADAEFAFDEQFAAVGLSQLFAEQQAKA